MCRADFEDLIYTHVLNAEQACRKQDCQGMVEYSEDYKESMIKDDGDPDDATQSLKGNPLGSIRDRDGGSDEDQILVRHARPRQLKP